MSLARKLWWIQFYIINLSQNGTVKRGIFLEHFVLESAEVESNYCLKKILTRNSSEDL